MFSVIELDDGLQLVPNSWLETGSNICFWPPNVRNQVKLNKMISSQADPQPSWGEIEFRRIFGEASSYVKGMAKLKLYRVISDLDSKPSDEAKAQSRELKRKNVSENESDEELPSIVKSSYPKSPPKKTSKQDSSTSSKSDQAPAVDIRVKCEPSSSHDESIPGNMLSTPDCLLTLSDIEHISAVEQALQVESSDCNCKAKNEKFIKLLEHILGKTNTILQKVQNLEERIDLLIPPSHTDKEIAEIMKRFPLNDLNELNALESFLSDDNNYKILVRSLKVIGGSSVYFIVANILKRIFTDKLAEMFSWAGAKGKRPFRDLLLSKAIFEITHLRYPAVTEYETAVMIANWLRHAKQRRERAEGAAAKKDVSLII